MKKNSVRLTALILALVLSLSLALTGCGSKSTSLKIAVPNDTTNEARALTLLEKNGFFKLKADAGLPATAKDFEEHPLNVTVEEVAAAQVPNVLQDEDYAVINSNYALGAGLNPVKDALAIESKDSPYANIVAIRTGDDSRAELQKLKAALTSAEVKKFIETEYKGAVVPAF